MMMMMMMMSELLEGCDRGRIIVAALTEFELGDAENWCRRYTIADYTQAIRFLANHISILSVYDGMPFVLKCSVIARLPTLKRNCIDLINTT
jgi:hypothetical protein